MRRQQPEVAIVGAGPYGLSVAAHLSHAGVETRVFGSVMQFWREQMPAGMLLRSRARASHIAGPNRALKLDDYARATGCRVSTPVTLAEFIAYGEWFQRQTVPDVDTRRVLRIDVADSGFRLTLQDHEQETAHRVVIATGIGPFGVWPARFQALPREYVSHSCEHQDLAGLRGQHVVIIGAGQSALESAALLCEAGADVELIARQPAIRWLATTGDPRRVCVPLLHPPPTGVGGRLLGWIVAMPDLYRRLPTRTQRLAERTYAPAGAGWLRGRLDNACITTGRSVADAVVCDHHVRLRLDDGSERHADHVLLATGYHVDVTSYGFLTREVKKAVETVNGYPTLRAGFESSLRGLHFVGAPSAMSFGPIMRFVVGTWYAAPTLTRRILGKRQPILSLAFP